MKLKLKTSKGQAGESLRQKPTFRNSHEAIVKVRPNPESSVNMCCLWYERAEGQKQQSTLIGYKHYKSLQGRSLRTYWGVLVFKRNAKHVRLLSATGVVYKAMNNGNVSFCLNQQLKLNVNETAPSQVLPSAPSL